MRFNNKLIPFIDIKKTTANVETRLKIFRKIMSTSGFYKVASVKMDEFENKSLSLSECVEVTVKNKSENEVIELLNIVDYILNTNEKEFFYYYYLRAVSIKNLRDSLYIDDMYVSISNCTKIKKKIIKKLIFAINEDIEYLPVYEIDEKQGGE